MPLVGVRSALRVLRMEKPHWSLGDLAHELGVSRERVRQLLAAEGLRTKRLRAVDVFDDALASMRLTAKPVSPREAHQSPDSVPGTVGDDAGSVSSVSACVVPHVGGAE